MRTRLADRLILRPTREPLPVEGKSRVELPLARGATAEVWVQRPPSGEADVFVVKFPGAGGRAERAGEHPADAWERQAEVWAVNAPGFGGARGAPSVGWLPSVADSTLREVERRAEGRPVIVTGNSLGCATALYAASRGRVSGLLLRNPPPLREVIRRRFQRPTLGLAGLVARQIPDALCAIENAARCDIPALFVVSGRDRVVPPSLQRRVIESYQGEKRVLHLPAADHHTPIGEDEASEYLALLHWLRDSTAK